MVFADKIYEGFVRFLKLKDLPQKDSDYSSAGNDRA
jgi:hypothetical protein